MARPNLLRHYKFRSLARALRSRAVALGSLELLWSHGYDQADPRLGDAKDVEELADWHRKSGELTAALLSAGFIERTEAGIYQIHDFWAHCPQYVHRRAEREKARTQSVASQRLATVQPMASQRLANDETVTSTPNTHVRTPNTQHTHTAPLAAGLTAHRSHAVCGRVCLPAFLFDELKRASGQADEEAADAYVRAFARSHQPPEGTPVGDDPIAYWRHRWREAHGTTKPSYAQERAARRAAFLAKGDTA